MTPLHLILVPGFLGFQRLRAMPYFDMLACGANFGPRDFETMWAAVPRFVRDTRAAA